MKRVEPQPNNVCLPPPCEEKKTFPTETTTRVAQEVLSTRTNETTIVAELSKNSNAALVNAPAKTSNRTYPKPTNVSISSEALRLIFEPELEQGKLVDPDFLDKYPHHFEFLDDEIYLEIDYSKITDQVTITRQIRQLWGQELIVNSI